MPGLSIVPWGQHRLQCIQQLPLPPSPLLLRTGPEGADLLGGGAPLRGGGGGGPLLTGRGPLEELMVKFME